MKRIKSKMTLVKKRIKSVQRKAKWAGLFYLLGTIVLAAAALAIGLLDNTILTVENPNEMPIMAAINKLTTADFANFQGRQVAHLAVIAVYLVMALVLVVNVLRSFGKLGMLFKRRASYTNGFNRNMYAMDDMSKIFSCSLATTINCTLLMYLGTKCAMYSYGTSVALSQMGLIVIAAGVAIRVLVGLIEGKVTLFTTGDHIEEETREFGLGVFFLRSLLQIAVTTAVIYLLAPNSNFGTNGILGALIAQPFDPNAVLAAPGLIPFVVEIVAWLVVMALVKRTVSAAEFNRDGMEAKGIKAYRVATFFTAVLVAVFAVLPMLTSPEAALNTNLLIVAAVAFVGFVLDCSIRPQYHNSTADMEMGVDEYFNVSDEMARYNNTII